MLTLSIQNLSVHFSGNHVINDVSATLHGGEMVAVVGRNGVGKTTLIKAIARLIKRSGDVALYDDKGNLFSDRDIAYVPQLESVTSRLTAFEMVLLGLVKDLRWKVTDEQIEKVADTLAELGLDSLSRKPVCSLSGGQKQRIAIARAMLKNAPVLILDEATAFADPDNEVKVQQALGELARGKTVFMIAHRLSTVANADRIFVLRDGKVIEDGRFDELKAQNGLFADMWSDYQKSVQWKVAKEA